MTQLHTIQVLHTISLAYELKKYKVTVCIIFHSKL